MASVLMVRLWDRAALAGEWMAGGGPAAYPGIPLGDACAVCACAVCGPTSGRGSRCQVLGTAVTADLPQVLVAVTHGTVLELAEKTESGTYKRRVVDTSEGVGPLQWADKPRGMVARFVDGVVDAAAEGSVEGLGDLEMRVNDGVVPGADGFPTRPAGAHRLRLGHDDRTLATVVTRGCGDTHVQRRLQQANLRPTATF